MRYLVNATEGPGFTSAEEAADLLEKAILPSFEALKAFEREGWIVAGGLPVGERAFVMIVEAASSDELDQRLRGLPIWGMMDWQVTPLQSISGRADIEERVLEAARRG